MSQTGANTLHSDADQTSNVFEERLRLFIDTIPTIVWRKLPDGSADFLNGQFRVSIDGNGKILFVNPATIRIFGYESYELIGQPLTMLMPEFMREPHRAGLQRYLATGQRRINWQGTELVGLHKNREEFPIEVSFGEVRKEGHSIFTGFIRDITERAEEEVRRLSGHPLRLQDELALFRVVQESLTNIPRHSGSFQAKIRIERDPRKLTLEISDKGSGIPGNLGRQSGKSSFGLGVGIPSMHERVKLIGGQLDIESSSGGTTVRATIPADD
jgi:PAS domain S-box-containing protein